MSQKQGCGKDHFVKTKTRRTKTETKTKIETKTGRLETKIKIFCNT